MKKKRERFRAALLLLLLLAGIFLRIGSEGIAFAAGGSWPSPPADIQSNGAILIDSDSNAVLYAKNEHEHYFPASITKVLTAVVVLEHVKNLDEKLTFSSSATSGNLEANSTVIGAVPGDKLSVRDCLYSLLLHSANDCANALAEHVAGSNEAFAELMNQKAAELGCTDSHFMNPSGLDNPEHYTSCADMAKILQYAIKNPTFRQIDSTQVYTHAPISKYPDIGAKENTIYAHHHMMRRAYRDFYNGVFAGKTGYTMTAGNTLVTACKRNNMTLICVILNGHHSQYSDTRKLFDFAYDNFSSIPISKSDSPYASLQNNLKVDGIPLVNALELSIGESDHITLPKDVEFQELDSSLSYELSEREKSDGSIARVDYRFQDHTVGIAYVKLLDRSENAGGDTAEDAVNAAEAFTESMPGTIRSERSGEEESTVAGQLSRENRRSQAPLIFDKKGGRIIVQKPILRVLAILLAIVLILLLAFLILYLYQRQEEFTRKRRRSRMLKHTRDLTREQKARRDLMLGKRSGRNKRRF